MNRRQWLCGLATATCLPARWLSAQQRPAQANKKRRGRPGRPALSRNVFTEPAAIEPITGFLPQFTPVDKGSMTVPFVAVYASVICHGSGLKSKNTVDRDRPLTVADTGDHVNTVELRRGNPSSKVAVQLACRGDYRTVVRWTLESTVDGVPEAHFIEHGNWDGAKMVVKARSWTQQQQTGERLIAKWSLLSLLAARKIKTAPLSFDLLDASTLHLGQTVRYTGPIEIPIAGGQATFDCYAHTGTGIVPTHYLVDDAGRVQLITQSTVNWALIDLRNPAPSRAGSTASGAAERG